MGMNLKNLYQNEYSFEETVNENFFKVENFTSLSAVSKITSSKDNNIINNEVYLISENDDNLFKDKVNHLTCYNANLGWIFYTPKTGNLMYLQEEQVYYYYDGKEWKLFVAGKDGAIGNTSNQQNVDITDLLLKGNNLSDLEDKQKARDNIEVYSKEETYNKSKCLEDIIDKDTACHNIGTLRDWEIRRIGDYKFSAQPQDHDNWLLCDGREIDRTTYNDLFSLLGTSFGNGNNETTFNLPDFRDKTIWGANNNLNTEKTSKLPNIFGSYSVNGNYQLHKGIGTATGCFSQINRTSNNNILTDSTSTNGTKTIFFDASSYNNIYGDSPIVQPPAICVNIFILAK